jgi:tyrosine-protein kinase Etk/Wzc
MATETSSSKTSERTNAANTPSDSGQEISILDLMVILAERRKLVGYVTAAFSILAILLSLILPKRYTATVTLLPPQQNSSLSGALATQLGSLGGAAALAGSSLGLKNPNEMYVGMLKSRTVEDAMVQHFGLMAEYHSRYLSDARRAFEKEATIDGSGKDGLIRIAVEDGDPRRAADLANGYVDQFRSLSKHLAITEASQRRLFFEQQLEEAKDNLANAEEEMKKTEQKTGMIQLDSQARALIESAASLRAQIATKEVQIESLRTFATSENAQLIQAQQELDGLQAQLAKLGGMTTGSDIGLIPGRGQVSEAGLEYVRRLRDVKYYETIFDILARQFEAAKLDEAKQGTLIQVVDPAIPPDRRSSPKRALIVIGATALGFMLGCISALLQSAAQRMMEVPESNQKLQLLAQSIAFRRRA